MIVEMLESYTDIVDNLAADLRIYLNFLPSSIPFLCVVCITSSFIMWISLANAGMIITKRSV